MIASHHNLFKFILKKREANNHVTVYFNKRVWLLIVSQFILIEKEELAVSKNNAWFKSGQNGLNNIHLKSKFMTHCIFLFLPESWQEASHVALRVEGDNVAHVEAARGSDDLPHCRAKDNLDSKF